MANIIVQAKSLKVTRALREFIQRQSHKLEKLKDLKVSKITVYLEQDTKRSTGNKKVSVKYSIELPGKDLWIEIDGYDFYDAIVDATNAALRKMRQTKEKKTNHRRLGKNQIDLI
ncbi:MAG TPA: HPF/RaiA family ribosome-associated protein [Candidatus Woesebacteria bacterium]|nr:HPF/RaiA family ribosome-associated protein [Candidatus Woesebacteria bacterium]